MTDALRAYVRESRRLPRLTTEQVRELARERDRLLAAGRDATAVVNCIVEGNVGLVIQAAARRSMARGEPDRLLDAIQNGHIGLIRAARGFDPEAGTKFSTYAVPWIVESIGRRGDDEENLIRLPRALELRVRQMRREGERPADGSRAWWADAARGRFSRFDDVADDDGASYLRMNADRDAPIARDDRAEQARARALVARALAVLAPRERDVLTARFGIGGEDGATLREVAEAQGTTKQAIHTTEKRALERLRRTFGSVEALEDARDDVTYRRQWRRSSAA